MSPKFNSSDYSSSSSSSSSSSIGCELAPFSSCFLLQDGVIGHHSRPPMRVMSSGRVHP